MKFAAHRIFTRACATLVLLSCMFCFSAAFAASPSRLTMRAEGDDAEVTWQLTADEVTSLSGAEVLEARGNVILRRGDDYLQADFARYYMTTRWVFLQGNVTAQMGENTLKAREMELDLINRTGWLKDGVIFMGGPHIYFSGERIDKHFGDVYSFINAKVTACDGDVPAWSLTAGEAVVEIDGYAQLWRTNFQVMDTPVMHVPWMVIPAKRERQSGFLPPQFGHSSNDGFHYNQPYFWAIDDSRDMLFNANLMTRRGVMAGVQYRSRPSASEALWLRFDWLNDSRTVRKDSKDWVNDSDNLIRTNSQRYWARGMFDYQLPGDPRWRLRGDIDYVSDQNYLHEFRYNNFGFHQTRTELFSTFNRELRERDLSRQSTVQLLRDWDRVSVALSGTYLQDQSLGHGNRPKASDTSVQQIPAFNAYLHKGALVPGLPLEIAADAEAAYMYREEGSRGARYQMTPQLSLPLRSRYGSVTATAGVRQALYGTDTYGKGEARLNGEGNPRLDGEGNPRLDGESQTVPFYSVDASTEFARVFALEGASLVASPENVGESRWTAMRHSIQPRVGYTLTPRKDQEKNPFYTAEDRIAPSNELTYSVTSVLTRKRERVVAGKPPNPGDAPEAALTTDYLDFLRVSVEQRYDFREATRADNKQYSRRPYSDVAGEVSLAVDETFSLKSRAFWSPYMNTLTRHEYGVNITRRPYGTLYAGFDDRRPLDEYTRYREDRIRSLVLRGTLDIFDPLSLEFGYRRDYERNKDVERSLGIVYTHQCFRVIGLVASDAGDVRYQLMVVLTGLGD